MYLSKFLNKKRKKYMNFREKTKECRMENKKNVGKIINMQKCKMHAHACQCQKHVTCQMSQ